MVKKTENPERKPFHGASLQRAKIAEAAALAICSGGRISNLRLRVHLRGCCGASARFLSAAMAIATAFTKKFGVKIPIVGAPMAGVSGPALAAAVASAGGLGYLGAAFYKEASQLRKCVDLSWTSIVIHDTIS